MFSRTSLQKEYNNSYWNIFNSHQSQTNAFLFFKSSFSKSLFILNIKQGQGFFVDCCGTSLAAPPARDQSSNNIPRPFSAISQLETFWDWSGILIHSNQDKKLIWQRKISRM